MQKNRLWLADLTKNEIGPNMQWLKVVDRYESSFHMCVVHSLASYQERSIDGDHCRETNLTFIFIPLFDMV